MASHKSPSPAHSKHRHDWIRYYLAAYNVLTTIGWSLVLIFTTAHLFGFLPSSSLPSSMVAPTKKSFFESFFSSFSSPTPSPVATSKLPTWARAFCHRATTNHEVVGVLTKWVQTAAVLEVVHVALGWVKSDLKTTALQVASRVGIVWLVVDRFPVAQSSIFYTTMVLSWSITEVVRYPYYAFTLIKPTHIPAQLTYLRYSTFYVLYPTGAASEALLLFATLPTGRYGWAGIIGAGFKGIQLIWRVWDLKAYFRAVWLAVQFPGFYFLYTHMIHQRAKVLGSHTHSVTANGPPSKRGKKHQ